MTHSAATASPKLPIEGLDAIAQPDRSEIEMTLERLAAGFQRRDAARLADVYSDDADWVNAFGSVKKGAAEIIAYLGGLFADTNFDEGELVAPPRSVVRAVADDVVVVSTRLRITGQGLVGGGSIPLRDNHSIRILQRQSDAHWRIVSEMYMDARTDQSYAGHS